MRRASVILAAIILSSLFYGVACVAQYKEIQYLSGAGSDDTVDWDFFCTGGRKSGYWTTIPVPSCWEQQGFGTYNYGRDYKTYGKSFRFADEKGMYRYLFKVPDSWKDKEVSIVFEGSMTDTEVKINGKSAGEIHQGAFYRFAYNITDKLKKGGLNLLEVTVSKMSGDKSVNNAERLADYWIFGGVFRPVYLEAVPREHIDYMAIDAKADGSLALNAFLKNREKAKTMVAEIIDGTGKRIHSVTVPVTDSHKVTLRTTVSPIRQWTSETPFLYTVTLSLKNGSKTLYRVSEKFGFRTIEVRRGDGIYLNGVQIKMKGVNRHCFWPEKGRTLNDQIQLQDVLLLKEMNLNAVRCSHYPPDKRFLELCDSLGLYVVDELAGWQKAYNTGPGAKLVREMVIRDVNHPAVIFWSNGNEGGTNKELDAVFGQYDPSGRPVIHPHHRPGNAYNGIDCNHYEDYYSTRKILADSLIYMPTEFLHAQDDGGGGTAMEDFWELHWSAKRSGGGFIWAMIDEGIVRTDMNGAIDVNGINANDGIMGPHREKEGSFFALREIFSPVKIRMKELPDGFAGGIGIENRFHFTNIDQCRFEWQLVNYRAPWDVLPGYKAGQSGIAIAPSIVPGAAGIIQLNLPENYGDYDALVLTARDPFNKEIYKWTWKIKVNNQLLQVLLSEDAAMDRLVAPVIEENDSTFQLTGGKVSVALSKATGMLCQVTHSGSGKLSFGQGPVWIPGGGDLVSSRSYKEGNNPVVEFIYKGAMKYARWKIFPTGWISLEYGYELTGDYPVTGISFDYPENYMLSKKWLGKGPYRQWKNRMQGMQTGVWQNLYNNTQTGAAPWQYPEFKGYFGEVTWMEFNTAEGKFYVASPDSGLFVRLFDFYALTGPRPQPDLPAGNISFLDCIPPAGTKLAFNINYQTATLGPQSELNHLNGMRSRTLFFYFGTLVYKASN